MRLKIKELKVITFSVILGIYFKIAFIEISLIWLLAFAYSFLLALFSAQFSIFSAVLLQQNYEFNTDSSGWPICPHPPVPDYRSLGLQINKINDIPTIMLLRKLFKDV